MSQRIKQPGCLSHRRGLTIADLLLRELVAAEQCETAWVYASIRQPGREVEVVCENHEYGREEVNGCYDASSKSWYDSHDGKILRDVRRWRELSR